MTRWKCGNCGEPVNSDGPLAFGCPHCKTRWVGGHAIWEVPPSRELQRKEENVAAYECAICGLRSEGHAQAADIVFQSRSCEKGGKP